VVVEVLIPLLPPALSIARVAAGIAEKTDPTLNRIESDSQVQIDSGQLVAGFVIDQLYGNLYSLSIKEHVTNLSEEAIVAWEHRVPEYIKSVQDGYLVEQPNNDQPQTPEDLRRQAIRDIASNIINEKVEEELFPNGQIVSQMRLKVLYAGYGNVIVDAFNQALTEAELPETSINIINTSGNIY
jgi:hypothetical protein